MSKAITLYADGRERREQVAVGLLQQAADGVPVGLCRLRVAQRRRFGAQPGGVGHRLAARFVQQCVLVGDERDRKSTRLNSSHDQISYAVFCLKKKKNESALPLTTTHTDHRD